MVVLLVFGVEIFSDSDWDRHFYFLMITQGTGHFPKMPL